ncbi:MAG: phospholipase D-like domain-containing protein [Elusimicrobia bacterium]|nr:phospholipase D-like domain-containing protein [Elusimicrobiota bacterium]
MKLFLKILPLLTLTLNLKAAELTIAESVPEETVYGSTLTARPLEVWLAMINGAAKTLDIEEFYIATAPGEPMEQVLSAIKSAAGRGVKVRVMVDSVMMKESGAPLADLGTAANIETRVINYKKLGGGIQHSKFFVADSKSVYVGSQNFDWRSLKHIHEIGLKIESPRAAKTFETVFEADWLMAASGNKADGVKYFKSPVSAAVTPKNPEKALLNGREVSYYAAFSPKELKPQKFGAEIDELTGLIKKAKKSLSAQVMTYSLKEYGDKEKWRELDNAFREAAKRGVSVRLIFADWSMGGKGDPDIKDLSQVKNITVKISSLPQYSGGFVPFARVEHCKYLVADDKYGFISTSNWSRNYFYDTRGAAVIIAGAAAVETLNDVFYRSWNGPYVKVVDPAADYSPVKKQ